MDTPEEWPYSLLGSQGLLRYDLPTQTLCHLCFLPNSNLPPKFSWPMTWASSGALPLFQLPPDLQGKPPAESSYLWELSLFCTLRGAPSSLKEARPLEGQPSQPTYTPAQVLPSRGTQTAAQILWAAALWPFVVILTEGLDVAQGSDFSSLLQGILLPVVPGAHWEKFQETNFLMT